MGGIEHELNRLRAQVELSWRQESRLLQWLGLRDGTRLLELGSGPGFFTESLLALLPTASITSVDTDPLMLREACRLRQAAPDRLHLLCSSALATGLKTSSFDFAVARLLLQHLRSPLAAACEALRVLKPGGRLAVIEVDASLFGIVEPMDPRLGAIHAKAGRRQARAGGDMVIGRKLWRILRAAGFGDVQLDAFVYHSDELGVAAFQPQLDPDRLRPALEEGYITRQEFELIRAANERFMVEPRAYIMMVGLICSGRKP
jgi:ubiquinone/menaquinone biosynthesis C-methylase UbiE